MNATDIDYRELFQTDRGAFIARLHEELQKPLWAHAAEPIARNSIVVAAMLRGTNGAPLRDLGIEWKSEDGQIVVLDPPNNPWRRLAGCLYSARKDDALLIFDTLARSIEGEEAGRCPEIASIALQRPMWRAQAIKNHPVIFRNGAPPESSVFPPREKRDGEFNAIDVFAEKTLPRENNGLEPMRETLRALLEAGVPCLRYPSSHMTQVHMAAVRQFTEGLQVFVDEFPDLINLADTAGKSPIHLLATNASFDGETDSKIQLLLQAGADATLKNKDGRTPLDIVVAGDDFGVNLEAATVLINSGAYTQGDVHGACEGAPDADVRQQVLTYFSAHQAQKILIENQDTASSMLRPL